MSKYLTTKLFKVAMIIFSVGVSILIIEGFLTLYLAYFDERSSVNPRTEMPPTLEEALGSEFVYSPLEGAPAWKGKQYKMASFEDWYNLIPRFQLYEGIRQVYRLGYRSRIVHLNAEGFRKTVNPSQNEETGIARTIWMFGGSTLISIEVPDSMTIPSFLSGILNAGTSDYFRIGNYAQGAYTSTNERILFFKLLKKKRPDIVIFYDGINEILLPFMNETGSNEDDHFIIKSFVKDLNHKIHSGIEQKGLITPLQRQLHRFYRQSDIKILHYLGKGALSVRDWLHTGGTSRMSGEKPVSRVGEKSSPIDPDEQPDDSQLAILEKAVQDYIWNIRIITAVCNKMGIQPIFLWQPVSLVAKKDLRGYRLYKYDVAWKPYYEDGYRMVRESKELNGLPNFYNIADIFDSIDRYIYIDWAHVVDDGNLAVAERIAAIIESQPRIVDEVG